MKKRRGVCPSGGTSVGVGASAAINSVDEFTTAGFELGTTLTGGDDLTLAATDTSSMTTTAQGGAKGGKVVVYSTDGEPKLESAEATEAMVDFYWNADLVIFDAMYSLADMITVKEDWGHSSNIVGVELCQLARARRLCLYHHEPVFDDERLATLLAETQRLEEITRARAGHRVEVMSAPPPSEPL